MAQEGTGGTASSATGASSAFGTSSPTTPGAGAAGTTAPGVGGSSAFGTSRPSVIKPGAGTSDPTGAAAAGTGAASTFGDGQPGTKPEASSEPTFSVPGTYGKPAQQFTPGEGRLARPKFRYSASLALGYDDNVFQTPTNSPGVPARVVVVLDDPGTPSQVVVGIGPDGEPQTVVAPGRAPTTRKVVIPGIPGQQRIGSFLNRGNASFDVQFASRKTLFTFDLNAGADVYWDRPGDRTDPRGSLSLMYLRRLTKRLQFTANVAAILQTQPDLSLINTSTQQGGTYLNITSRANLSYRFSPRFSASGSLSFNALRYQETVQQFGDYNETILGTELRYLFSPRFTLLGQLRYGTINYVKTDTRDAATVYALIGGETTLSRRFTATLLMGASFRTFAEGDEPSTAPYLESTLSYQLARATLLQFNVHFGFEAPPDAQSELIALRTGLNLVHSFSPRLRGNVGLDYVRQTTTFSSSNAETVQNTIQLGLGLAYTLTRQWTLNANYSYIGQRSTFSANDYFRNQTFVSAGYEF